MVVRFLRLCRCGSFWNGSRSVSFLVGEKRCSGVRNGPRAFIVVLPLLLMIMLFPPEAIAAELTPNYQQSVILSRQHADSPSGWVPDPLAGDKRVLTITGNPATENPAFGLKYDSTYGDGKDYLIVRTLTKASYYQSNYVNQSGYRIFGNPTTDAAWVTTGNEMTTFLRQNGAAGSIVKLLERGLGMKDDGSHTAIVEYAVVADNNHILRPTKNPDIRQYTTNPAAYGTYAPFAAKPADMTQSVYDAFVGTALQKGYYQYWKEKAYDSAATSSNAFPWTQLGYTFFWGNGAALADIQGMSEFIIPGGTSVQIYAIYSPQSYIYTLNKNGAFSSDADAQFGNGFASFKVTGPCDTIWAGHAFQRNVSHNTAAGMRNQIIIEPEGSIAGGQGLLIWSLNYDVENRGTIIGATEKKFGLSDTENIAILFKGDSSTRYGVPIIAGSNSLINFGTIMSPGIAVRAEAGNTHIINRAGGVIAGGTYAIQTGAGNDTVTVTGGTIAGRVDLGTGTDRFDITGTEGSATLNLAISGLTSGLPHVLVRDAGRGTVTIADNTRLAVTTVGRSLVRNNDRFLIVDTDALAVNPALLSIQNDPALPMVGFLAAQEGNRLYLVAARDNSYYMTRSGNASLGNLLDTLANTATGDMADVLGDLDKSGDPRNALTLQPLVDGAAIQGSHMMMNRHIRAVSDRMGELRFVRTDRGGIWNQSFGAAAYQRADLSAHAYNAHLWGTVFGADRYIADRLLAGISAGYVRNRMVKNDPGIGDLETGSYQVSTYAYLDHAPFYVDAVLSFAHDTHETARRIAFGMTDRTAKSRFSGQQYSGYLETGVGLETGTLSFTPLLSLQYARLSLHGYEETGAGALNLSVHGQQYTKVQSGIGAKVAYPGALPTGKIDLELQGKWLYDLVAIRQQAVATFAGGGSFFTGGAAVPRSGGTLGTRLSLVTKGSMVLSLAYDYEWKSRFSGHSGMFALRYSF